MKFTNDPKFDQVPLVGEGSSLVALRTRCGEAVRWVPGTSDAAALVKFLAGALELVPYDGELYARRGDSLERVVELAAPCVVVRPPAGEVSFVANAEVFKQSFSVVESVAKVYPTVATSTSVPIFAAGPKVVTSSVDVPVKAAPRKAPAAKKAASPARKAAVK